MSSNYEYWKSPAVKWLLKEFKVEDVESFMRSEALKLLCITGQDSPPFSPLRVASLRGIKGIKKANISSLSELVPVNGGFEILINSRVSNMYPGVIENSIKTEQRSTHFTIAHEIGHTFFYDFRSSVPSRPFRDSGSIAEERLCDIFATELLMPAQQFSKDANIMLKKYRSLPEALLRLRNLYKITLQPVAIRLNELGTYNSNKRPVVIKWTNMVNPKKPLDSKSKLRVNWAEPASFPYIPKYRSAPVGSIFEQAIHSKETVNGSVSFKFGGLNGNYAIEALALDNGNKDDITGDNPVTKSVLSVVWLNGLPQKRKSS